MNALLPDYQAVKDRREALGRKFVAADLEGDTLLTSLAEEYARTYAGTFDYLRDMRRAMEREGWLSYAQAAGTLNCVVAELNRTPRGRQAEPVRKEVANGTYTITGVHETEWVTLRLIDCPWDDVEPGTQLAQFLSGSDNEHDFTGFAFVRGRTMQVWSRFTDTARVQDALRVLLDPGAQPSEYGLQYALQTGRCCKCNRKLTVPASLHMGMGPVCAGIEKS